MKHVKFSNLIVDRFTETNKRRKGGEYKIDEPKELRKEIEETLRGI